MHDDLQRPRPQVRASVRTPRAGSGSSPGRRAAGRRPLRSAVLVFLALAGFAAAVAWGATPASAQAVLEDSEPPRDAVVDDSPDEITLTFNERINGNASSVRVFDGEGFRVDRGDGRFSGQAVTVGLPPLKDGTYIVSFRLNSEDGLPLTGAYTFSVGEAGRLGPGLLNRYDSSNRTWELYGWISRLMAYAGLLTAVGGVLFISFVDRTSASLVNLSWAIVAVATVGMVGAVFSIVVHAALISGQGLMAVGTDQTFNETVLSRVGLAGTTGMAGAFCIQFGVGWLLVRPTSGGRTDRTLALVGAVLSIVGLLIIGHPTASTPRLLTLLSDATHLVAASVWLGGLLSLLIVLRHRMADDPEGTAATVGRFSTIAAGSLVALAGAGLVLSWSEVRSIGNLFSTTYGNLLVMKLIVVGAVVVIAAYNRYRLVPAIQGPRQSYWSHDDDRDAASESDPDHDLDGAVDSDRDGIGDEADERFTEQRRPDRAGGRPRHSPGPAAEILRRTIMLELVGLTVVLALTAVLVNVTPARAAGLGLIGATASATSLPESTSQGHVFGGASGEPALTPLEGRR